MIFEAKDRHGRSRWSSKTLYPALKWLKEHDREGSIHIRGYLVIDPIIEGKEINFNPMSSGCFEAWKLIEERLGEPVAFW